ncbi:MAG: helix-turn-helix domain-containing protein [Gammaproteobacteria bacterium]
MSTALKKIQVIQSLNGEPEYVLLPYDLYQMLRGELNRKLSARKPRQAKDYVQFRVEDYVDNPVALARIKARISQSELARRLDVSQAYISKIERQPQVTAKLLQRVSKALRK